MALYGPAVRCKRFRQIAPPGGQAGDLFPTAVPRPGLLPAQPLSARPDGPQFFAVRPRPEPAAVGVAIVSDELHIGLGPTGYAKQRSGIHLREPGPGEQHRKHGRGF